MSIDPGTRLGPYEILAKVGPAVWAGLSRPTHDGRFVMIAQDPAEFAPVLPNIVVNRSRELMERVPIL
jgi:hypothetical protein